MADPVAEAIERGMNRARLDDWAAAAEAFRKAAAADSQCAEARFRLGWAMFRDAEARKPTLADLALGYGAQMLGLEPLARERSRRFSAHRRLLREAVHWLREAISRDPAHARAQFYLAQALRELGYRSEAVEAARIAAGLEPANTRYASLVQTYAAEGRSTPGTAVEGPRAARLTWDDVVLEPRTKRELRQMQLMIEKPDLARDLGVDPPTGILLKGAPGTGKTTIARVLANEARCKFFSISPADINQMYVGESEKRVRRLFDEARAHPPAIIFVDEIDALLPSRQGGVAIHSDKVVNQFLQEMDGMTPNHHVLVVGATNRPDMLDPAVRRGGRLSREIEIPLPGRDARLELLRLFTSGVKLSNDVELEALANESEGLSGADLRAAVTEAGLQALIRIADLGDECDERCLTSSDFEAALANLDHRTDV
ncbi:MAG TPA: AAA family ATPase [Chthonomonadales bacterium]|nr:AAA family ATPase [Chthonomonadales bacterium]